MRKFLILGSLAALASCGGDSEGYSISGTVEGASNGQHIYINELNETNTQAIPVDTIKVVEGKFEADLPEKESPTISFLSLEGTRGHVVYIADNTPISFTVYPDSLFSSKVEGGEDNKILYDYLEKIKNTNKEFSETRTAMRKAIRSQDSVKVNEVQKTQQEISERDMADKKELVRQHPKSIVAVMVLQDMINTRMYSGKELKELYEGLSPEIKNTNLAEILEKNLERLTRTDVGNKAPGFSASTPEGKELALEDVLGKVTLVDFWASWCKPCRVENPNLVKVYKAYHDKGFNIIQVSLDRPGQKDKWVEAIKQDQLGAWNHVSNLMFWQDPIAAEYGVRGIPAAFLLDENGMIIGKNLRGKELEDKVAEVLEK